MISSSTGTLTLSTNSDSLEGKTENEARWQQRRRNMTVARASRRTCDDCLPSKTRGAATDTSAGRGSRVSGEHGSHRAAHARPAHLLAINRWFTVFYSVIAGRLEGRRVAGLQSARHRTFVGTMPCCLAIASTLCPRFHAMFKFAVLAVVVAVAAANCQSQSACPCGFGGVRGGGPRAACAVGDC